ncbi:hypothetical protein [Streptomyces achromogenes]|uniref:hypothetical protein n=1 Tax=Streptomyces achromogenes TaxID=67255 RepID=UPI0034247D2A
MSKSLSLSATTVIEVDDLPALRLSPEGTPALPLITGPRLAVIGRIGPKCRTCRDFERVVTRTGTVVCPDSVHAETKPQLPLRPTPHERDGRQDTPQPVRPHSLLVG